jgi:hypothetical protein
VHDAPYFVSSSIRYRSLSRWEQNWKEVREARHPAPPLVILGPIWGPDRLFENRELKIFEPAFSTRASVFDLEIVSNAGCSAKGVPDITRWLLRGGHETWLNFRGIGVMTHRDHLVLYFGLVEPLPAWMDRAETLTAYNRRACPHSSRACRKNHRSETRRINTLANPRPLGQFCIIDQRHAATSHAKTYCVCLSYTSSPSDRRLCICPWATSLLPSASPCTISRQPS